MSTPLQSFSMQDVCTAWGLSPRAVSRLVRDGGVGHFRGKNRSIRFLPEHIAQLQAALEVRPRETPLALATGQTARAAAIRRRRTA